MKRCLLALLLAVLLLSGCSSSVPEPAASEPAAIEPTTSPTLSPTPEPTPEPTAVPVLQPETVLSGATGGASPYILSGSDDTTVRVCWTGRYSRSGDVRVFYAVAGEDDALPKDPGTAGASGVFLPEGAFSGQPMLYTATLSVEPGTRYVYGISEDGAAPDTVYHFRTNEADHLSAVAVSDTHLYCNEWHPALLEDTLEAALGAVTGSGGALDMVIHTGDIMEQPRYSLDALLDHVPMLHSFVFTPVAGNHDSLDAVRARFPMEDADRQTGDYWFVRGGVMFVGIEIGLRYYTYHADYLREVLENAPEHNWTVVLIHYAMRSNGSHAIDGPVMNFRYFLEPVMDEFDVDLVIAGHDHEYNRTVLLGSGAPEQPDGDTGAAVLYKKPGERIYITLPSGTGLKYYDSSIHDVDFAFAAEGLEHEPGYVFFDFSPEEISLSAYSAATGEEIDAVTLRRGAPITEEE